MGTIMIPASLPSPEEDAQELRKAFQGWGTDEKAIIEVLGHRTAAQRLEIADAYRRLFDETLLQRLHSELSGDFRNAVMLWTMDPAERDAQWANEALKSKRNRNNIAVLVEVSCASSPDHLMDVRKYACIFLVELRQLFHNQHIEHALQPFIYMVSETEELKLLVRLVTSYRYAGEHVDEELAKTEAGMLHDGIMAKKLDHDQVTRIISSRSKYQLRETFNQYHVRYGKAIEEDIEGDERNQLASMLKDVVWCLVSPEKYFAKVLRTSIVGLGTDEDSLTRAIVGRAELDMKKIKEEYGSRYRTTVNDDVTGDTSGDYMDFLLALVGTN